VSNAGTEAPNMWNHKTGRPEENMGKISLDAAKGMQKRLK